MKSSLSIPPLPTSKRIKTSTNVNKENESSNACQSVVQGDSKRPLTSSANSPSKPAITSSPLDTNNVSTLNTSISANGTPLRSRVLRMGETVEDLFCLIPPFETEESLKHLKLCEDIANDIDGSSNSLMKWRAALEVSITQNERFASGENANEVKSNLLRLHKRAASRFFSYKVENENDRKNILAIFLLYAKAQSLYGSIESAINTYRLIQTKGIGDKDANLYVHMAEFELEKDKSIEAMDNALNILENGLSSGAVPKESLDEFKERIHDMKKAVLNHNADGDRIRPTNVSHSNPASSIIPSLNKSRLARVPRPNRLKTSSSIRVGGVQRITSLTGPKRVNATIAQHDEDEEEDDENDNIPIDPNKKIKLDILEKTPPKITKSDISYLLNWNPTGPGSGSTESKKEYDTNLPMNAVAVETSSSKPSQRVIYEPELNRIEESNRENSASTNNSGSLNSTKSQHSSIHSQSSNERKDETSEPLPTVQSEKSPTIITSADTSAVVNDDPATKCHPDFMSIFSRQNVISVNREPYVKLGVIGKGGSCKVYRTLSRDRQIVAIKKVKLAGMSKKSIEGYANEISLLRRLRGNPAIIQMYDSEVDLQRKAIYLVMELGEVDLNHVLQQQGQQKDGRRNMNFIRLTWQQMLSAVHCIHEERIIHSDLKPANFLFVRGCLKLIDFGIAKAILRDDTVNIYRESQVGTLNYMSPESILDTGEGVNGGLRMKCGRPSDVWSLGCILYQMCYGKTPFADLNMFQKLQAIVDPKHEILFPSTVDSAAVDAMKLCLKRKPEDRAPIVGRNGLLNEHRFLHSR